MLPGNATPYRDAMSMSIYNRGMSSKPRYMAGLLKQVILDKKEPVLIFVDCSSAAGMPKCIQADFGMRQKLKKQHEAYLRKDRMEFLRVLELNVIVINAAQTPFQRDAAVQRFNDPSDPWKSSSSQSV